MAKKNREFGPDFRFLVRVNGTDLDGKSNVVQGLTGMKGLSARMARIVANEANLPKDMLMGDLSDEQIATMTETIENVGDLVPSWMRNRQMDPETGDDLHLIGTEIDLTLRDDLNRLKKIRSWRGIRHDANLPVRGQRTKANGRTGMTVGVQRKK